MEITSAHTPGPEAVTAPNLTAREPGKYTLPVLAGEHGTLCPPWRGTGQGGRTGESWEGVPSASAAASECPGFSLPSQDTHDLKDTFVPLPVHANILGIETHPYKNSKSWAHRAGN